MSAFHADLSINDIRRLSHEHRIPYIHQIRVYHPLMNAILKQMDRCYEDQPYAAEPPCLMVPGPTGAGKSTLMDIFVERHTSDDDCLPVVKVVIELPATVKNLASLILRALGDPLYDRGSTIQMTNRIELLCKKRGVRTIILDEIQHFYDPDKQKIIYLVTNWLKTLIKDRTKVAFLLVGLEFEAEALLRANKQLLRLFGTPKVLKPFEWNETRPETIKNFRGLLQTIEAELPLNEPSQLWDMDTAQRFFIASEGILSYVMKLVREATRHALELKLERLDLTLLAEAFDECLAPELRNIANPFRGALPQVRAPQPPMPVPNSATSNRSKAAKERPPRLHDIRR
jgi:hypothetical protein